MMKRFSYYGIFLDTATKNMLMDKLTDNPGYNKLLGKADKIFIDHCTLIHHSQVDNNLEKYGRIQCFEGESIWPIVITHVGYSDKAMAFRVMKSGVVEPICTNEIPHITIATFNEGKPVESNNITHWEKLNKVIIIKGTIMKI